MRFEKDDTVVFCPSGDHLLDKFAREKARVHRADVEPDSLIHSEPKEQVFYQVRFLNEDDKLYNLSESVLELASEDQ